MFIRKCLLALYWNQRDINKWMSFRNSPNHFNLNSLLQECISNFICKCPVLAFYILEIYTLKFDNFYIFVFVLEAKIQITNSRDWSLARKWYMNFHSEIFWKYCQQTSAPNNCEDLDNWKKIVTINRLMMCEFWQKELYCTISELFCSKPERMKLCFANSTANGRSFPKVYIRVQHRYP